MVALALAAVLLAADDNPFLAEGIRQLRRLDEVAALKTFEKARAWKDNTPEQLAKVLLFTGMAYAAVPREKEAIESFKAARLLDPQLALVWWAPPRVREWWKRLKGEIEPEPPKPSRLGDKEPDVDAPAQVALTPPDDEHEPLKQPSVEVARPERVPRRSLRSVFWVPLVVAVAFFALGSVAQLPVRDAQRRLDHDTFAADDARRLADSGKLWQNVSWAGFAAGLVCVAISVGLAAFGGPRDAEPAP